MSDPKGRKSGQGSDNRQTKAPRPEPQAWKDGEPRKAAMGGKKTEVEEYQTKKMILLR
ncbi:MAG: hypothetical protein U5J96_00540 [Ignavibacteriaceae bacterium]|nr:hypothetical protein [Ignavibacteriaceae bacterium]